MFLQSVTGGQSGIDATTLLAIVTPLVGIITAVVTAFYKHLLNQIAERDKRLAAYESVPELLERVERWMEASEHSSSDSPPQPVHRTSRRPRAKKGADQ